MIIFDKSEKSSKKLGLSLIPDFIETYLKLNLELDLYVALCIVP